MSAADQRTVSVPVRTVELVQTALVGALRLSASHDAVNAALAASDRPQPSGLSQQIKGALDALKGDEPASPPERVDQHLFSLSNLDEQFIRELLLERGWQQAHLIVGSAQGETLARQMLHRASPELHVADQVKLLPLSGGHRVEPADAWTLVEFKP